MRFILLASCSWEETEVPWECSHSSSSWASSSCTSGGGLSSSPRRGFLLRVCLLLRSSCWQITCGGGGGEHSDPSHFQQWLQVVFSSSHLCFKRRKESVFLRFWGLRKIAPTVIEWKLIREWEKVHLFACSFLIVNFCTFFFFTCT